MKSELGNLLKPPLNLLRPPKFVATAPVIPDPPKISEQAKEWGECHIVDFREGKPSGVDYFNCSYLSHTDRDWLLVRQSQYDPKIRVGLNSLTVFGLTGGVPQIGWPLQLIKHDHREHAEDGRIFHYNGSHYITANAFVWHADKEKWTGAHQTVWRFDQKWKCLERFDPVYGNNGPTIGCKYDWQYEKNWLFYPFDKRLFLIYKSHPLVVAEFDWKFKAIRETVTHWENPWKFGQIRGGSNPVLASDGLLWTFFHSSLPMGPNQKRRYFMGALGYEPAMPFKVRKITPKPLLIGSKKDRWYDDKPAVVFPGSAALKGDLWTGALGVNDLDSAIFTIHHSEVLKRAVDV